MSKGSNTPKALTVIEATVKKSRLRCILLNDDKWGFVVRDLANIFQFQNNRKYVGLRDHIDGMKRYILVQGRRLHVVPVEVLGYLLKVASHAISHSDAKELRELVDTNFKNLATEKNRNDLMYLAHACNQMAPAPDSLPDIAMEPVQTEGLKRKQANPETRGKQKKQRCSPMEYQAERPEDRLQRDDIKVRLCNECMKYKDVMLTGISDTMQYINMMLEHRKDLLLQASPLFPGNTTE